MLFEASYISSNCNQTPTISHWGKNDLICYGSCNAVLIYDPNVGSGGKVIDSLVSHKQRVNSVRWIGGNDHETELISGSSDGDAIVWTLKGIYVPSILKGHQGNVNIVDGLYKAADKLQTVVATAAMDSTVKIWYREQPRGQFIMSETLDFSEAVCVGLRLTFLPNTKILLLACAMDNSKIQLYVESETETDNQHGRFLKSACLSGHEDWVRGLDFTISDDMDLLLASSSQDNFIRLWKITKSDKETKNQAPASASANTSIISTKNVDYRVFTESVLTGHEGWVYSVHWNPKCLQLLSSSLDKTIIIWEYNSEVNMWTEKVRLGEVGGNTLGFYGGLFGPDGKSILAHSYHGAFHMWRNDSASGTWEPQVTVGGHFGEVVDLAWEPRGEFLISVSADQTARIHAPWPKDDAEIVTWHEIARPQVHGYDMTSIAVLSRYKYASSAEEKVIRTFEAPRNFIENFRRICKVHDHDVEVNEFPDKGPEGASVPSLGLSNKAVFDANNESNIATSNKEPYPAESHFTSVHLEAPPTEETLLQNTLWPEIQKLYGHGYEVYCLAASHDGRVLASACKATTKEHAAIILWDTRSWRKVQELVSHTLTVVQIAFSPDDEHILSVSRDRRWSLFRRDKKFSDYHLVATTDKNTSIHTRIIWCCAWTHDSNYFATGSRDGKIVCWTRNKTKQSTDCLGEYECVPHPLEHKDESITALAFAPMNFNYYYIMAVGFEAGRIMLYHWNTENFSPLLLLITKHAHHLTVRRLAFRPKLGRAGYKNGDQSVLQLASCGSDHSVRIYDLFLNKIK